MANVLYDLGRESFLKGEISWDGDTIAIALVDSDVYTPNLMTDQFLSDVTARGSLIRELRAVCPLSLDVERVG